MSGVEEAELMRTFGFPGRHTRAYAEISLMQIREETSLGSAYVLSCGAYGRQTLLQRTATATTTRRRP